MLKPSALAPKFTLQADDGSTVRLADLRGQKVVLYFYPKDDTPGCTKEACEFRDHSKKFDKSDTVVLGVSPDTVASHKKFREKYKLDFRLLADPDHKVAEAYGVWQEKSMYGRKYMGIVRSAFVIDEAGKLSGVYYKVSPKDTVPRVEEALGA
jgi:peroxiredoxin Q/BCP